MINPNKLELASQQHAEIVEALNVVRRRNRLASIALAISSLVVLGGVVVLYWYKSNESHDAIQLVQNNKETPDTDHPKSDPGLNGGTSTPGGALAK
ncbi:MAG: hypothetical protein HY286_14665 [Planctomycetes bacterium]|nr:hypothetical protein [Planctomycetota bacterium]